MWLANCCDVFQKKKPEITAFSPPSFTHEYGCMKRECLRGREGRERETGGGEGGGGEGHASTYREEWRWMVVMTGSHEYMLHRDIKSVRNDARPILNFRNRVVHRLFHETPSNMFHHVFEDVRRH